MKTNMKHVTASALMVMGLGFAGAASAQNTWSLLDSCTPNSGTTQLATCTSGGKSVAVTAYAAGSGANFAKASMTEWYTNGIGVSYSGEPTGSPQHAIDNNGKTELVMLNFTTATMLSALSIGWFENDADISVLRWTGQGAPDLTTNSTGNLTSSGWTLVASRDVDPSYSWNFSGGGYSSWWLISSYFGASGYAADGSGYLDKGNDYFKLLSFTGTTQSGGGSGGSVPEPGTLALAGLALAGIVGAKRRRARTV
nr:exosortase-dependent surface protein XDP1 [Rubrivivax benzoatilyticus]